PAPGLRSLVAGGAVVALGLAACGGLTPVTSGSPVPAAPDSGVPSHEADGTLDELGPPVRVAIATAATVVELGSGGSWRLEGPDGRAGVLVRGAPGERWRVERRDRRLRAVSADGRASAWRDGALVARPAGAGALITVGDR